jgi:CubicO group peptidase (beta-lactamase class C family)
LIGIALDKGLIEGLDVKASALFPEYPDAFEDAGKQAITLRHLLTMTAGMQWDEWTYPYTDDRNDHVGLARSPDPVRYGLMLPMVAEPGKSFAYNSGISIALGQVVRNVSGVTVEEFAAEHLFGPLGIEHWFWYAYPNGAYQTGGGLHLCPRDMTAFGQMFLDGGRGIVSSGWVEESTRKQAPDADYGYQWWPAAVDADPWHYSALGRGGQSITVIPSLRSVVVFTAWNDGTLPEQRADMLRTLLA